jgi:ankyrin repeat protein
MKYIKQLETVKHMTYSELMQYRKIRNYTPTEKLLHLFADEMHSQWEIIKERDDDNYEFVYNDFKKISPSKVIKLLNEGADINVQDKDWGSPIKLAVERQDFKIVKCLIENGANVNGTDLDRKYSTPLYVASSIKNHPTSAKILKYLIDNEADINKPNDGQVLPIHHAVFKQAFENAIILLKAGSKLENGYNSFISNKQKNDINYWMKVGNYEFEKVLCQMYPDEIVKIDDNKIDDKIKKEFSFLFQANKYNL